MARKTFSVDELKNWMNTKVLNGSEPTNIDYRAGACVVLEEVLLRTGNYNGFKYLDPKGNQDPTFDATQRFYF